MFLQLVELVHPLDVVHGTLKGLRLVDVLDELGEGVLARHVVHRPGELLERLGVLLDLGERVAGLLDAVDRTDQLLHRPDLVLDLVEVVPHLAQVVHRPHEVLNLVDLLLDLVEVVHRLGQLVHGTGELLQFLALLLDLIEVVLCLADVIYRPRERLDVLHLGDQLVVLGAVQDVVHRAGKVFERLHVLVDLVEVVLDALAHIDGALV